jgi:hypothetical protein
MKKTFVYIDRFNLYYRLLKQRPQYKRVNPFELVRTVLDPDNDIIKVRYFTARVSGIPTGLATSSIAPVADIFRTAQSIAPPSNSIVWALGTAGGSLSVVPLCTLGQVKHRNAFNQLNAPSSISRTRAGQFGSATAVFSRSTLPSFD